MVTIHELITGKCLACHVQIKSFVYRQNMPLLLEFERAKFAPTIHYVKKQILKKLRQNCDEK